MGCSRQMVGRMRRGHLFIDALVQVVTIAVESMNFESCCQFGAMLSKCALHVRPPVTMTSCNVSDVTIIVVTWWQLSLLVEIVFLGANSFCVSSTLTYKSVSQVVDGFNTTVVDYHFLFT